MGIRGLMTYVNRNPSLLEPYELHGGYLVIDGLCLVAQLYNSTNCNCAFGGDYDRYARSVDVFFDDLLQCEVTPLVILDGAEEKKKAKTVFKRKKEKLLSAINYTPATQSKIRFMPLNLEVVFKTVLMQKGIRMAHTIFEADPGIAGVAKVLDCPVLSYDSDFFIFGVKYICINSLEPFIVKRSKEGGYIKRCKLFKPENVLAMFPGLDSSVLPLSAVLLGNDYVDTKVFKNFFDCLKLPGQSIRLYNEEQRKIHTTLCWLRNYNLNDAVAAILSKIPKKRRRQLLCIVEDIVNGYLDLPCEALVPLDFQKLYESEMNTRSQKKPFKFRGDTNNLESKQLWKEESQLDAEISSLDEDIDNEYKSLEQTMDNDSPVSEKPIVNCRSWFASEFTHALLSTNLINMIHNNRMNIAVQIEDFRYPSVFLISQNIVRVIHGLLVSDSRISEFSLSIREGTNFVVRQVETLHGTQSTKFPALCDLRDTAMSTRKRIFDETLGITSKESLLEEIPEEWRVYVAAVCYWMTQKEQPFRNSCHLHAALFTMLLGVVDKKLGYHRFYPALQKAYKADLARIEEERGRKKPEKKEQMKETIAEALEDVSKDDCLLAANFFYSNYTMDKQLVECPRKFNRTVVHVFCQLQCCVLSAIQLNDLLGRPYQHPILADLFNGTMLYNLYINFKKRNDPEVYIATTLEHSPSLLRLLNLLTVKIKDLLGAALYLGCASKGMRKYRGKKKDALEDEHEDNEEEAERIALVNAF